ncbi:F-box only protein 16 isoform X3 [Callorhinus ursinus]|uniref:F-box only protein 16 isoform X3 n=1 Tax=Callorhinus ursinus TaxID=34884 RepID=UPI003CD015B0
MLQQDHITKRAVSLGQSHLKTKLIEESLIQIISIRNQEKENIQCRALGKPKRSYFVLIQKLCLACFLHKLESSQLIAGVFHLGYGFSYGKIFRYFMMAFAPPKSIDGPKMQTKMSTWTPLNHQLLNDRVFEERRALLGKWVSWHWKNLTELDQLWMLKCLRFNWYINFSPTPFEQGIWKKHYIQMVKELHVTKPKTPPKDGFSIANVQPVTSNSAEEKQSPASAFRSSSSLRKKTHPGEKELPPWRSSDKHPTDIIRFNYLDNCDPIEQIWQGRRKRHEMNPDFSRQSHDKKNKLQDRSKLRKAQSLNHQVVV